MIDIERANRIIAGASWAPYVDSTTLDKTAKVGAQPSKPKKAKEVTEERMSRRYYVEKNNVEGLPPFVQIKRSRSHGQHHHDHHRYYDRDYYKVSVDEWNRLAEREATLAAENESLKADLARTTEENQRLTGTVVPQLKSQISMLYSDNAELRRSLNGAGDRPSDVDWLEKKVSKLERDNRAYKSENEDLLARVKELRRQVDGSCSRRVEELQSDVKYWKDQCRKWKKVYDGILKQRDSLQDLLAIKSQKIQVYEEMLRRHRIL